MAEISESIARGELDIKIKDIDSSRGAMKSMYMMITKLREVIGVIAAGSNYIVDASEQLSSSSQEMSQSSNEQASSTEEVSSTMEQIHSNIRQNAGNAHQTEEIAIKAAEDIESGSKSSK